MRECPELRNGHDEEDAEEHDVDMRDSRLGRERHGARTTTTAESVNPSTVPNTTVLPPRFPVDEALEVDEDFQLVDFNTEFSWGPSRPHGIAFK